MSGGAPKGNTNALKHGLYAVQFNERQRKSMRRMAWNDHRHEVFGNRGLAEEIYRRFQMELAKPEVDVNKLVSLSQAFAILTTAAGTSALRHANLNGKNETEGDALSQALGDVPFDLMDHEFDDT